jgi:hypothetical protein
MKGTKGGRMARMHTFYYNMHTMKARVTLTLDPKAVRRAKNVAHHRKLSVSGLVEELLLSTDTIDRNAYASFAEKWGGALKLARGKEKEPLFQALKSKYGL